MLSDEISLSTVRARYQPEIPALFQTPLEVVFRKELPISPSREIAEQFSHISGLSLMRAEKGAKSSFTPQRIGVVFSGGQAPGGHNVVAGIFDAIKALNPSSELFGFLGGPSGIVKGEWLLLTEEKIASYRNQGGFDLLGSGRTKIESDQQMQAAAQNIKKAELNGLVIIGGDDSNTNAAHLAEFFLKEGVDCSVIGVPKTIDGDLRNSHVEISFGFDTACRIYSEMIGNIARDALSAKKYTHFIKLMGRSASHVTLECALQTHPNLALISEEIESKQLSLKEIAQQVADLIEKRSQKGHDYGVILIPEGLIEFIPEIKELIKELNKVSDQRRDEIINRLSQQSRELFSSLPSAICDQLLLDRDPHGNVQVSKINTEQLLSELVAVELKKRGFKGSFNPQHHFLGYEGRSAFPTNFDANYCQSLGWTAALLIAHRYTGMMACVQGLKESPTKWRAFGLPLASLMTYEERKGLKKAVIPKVLVNLKGELFEIFSKKRAHWAQEDDYLTPGPIQFFGDEGLINRLPYTLVCSGSKSS